MTSFALVPVRIGRTLDLLRYTKTIFLEVWGKRVHSGSIELNRNSFQHAIARKQDNNYVASSP